MDELDDELPSPLSCNAFVPSTPLKPILKESSARASSLRLNLEGTSADGCPKNVQFSTPLEIPGNDLILTTYTPRGLAASHKIRKFQEMLCNSCDALKTKVSTTKEDCRQFWWNKEKKSLSSLQCFTPSIFSDDSGSDSVTDSLLFNYNPGFFETSASAVRNCSNRFLEKLKKSLTSERMSSEDVAEPECVSLLSNMQPEFGSFLSDYAPMDLISISFDYGFWEEPGEGSDTEFLHTDQDSDLISITYHFKEIEGTDFHLEPNNEQLDAGSLDTLEQKRSGSPLLKLQDDWDLFDNESHCVFELRPDKESKLLSFRYQSTDSRS